MPLTEQSAFALFQPGARARATLLCVLLAACGSDESSKGFPVGAGGEAGGGMGGTGGTAAGQGGLSGASAGTAGLGGMASLPTAGAAGMIGGVGGSAGGVAGGMAGGEPAGSGGVGGMSGMAGVGGAGGAGAGGSGGSAPTGDFCARWTAARANLMDGAWNGNAASCDPGSLPDEALETALGLVNLYRSMAGLEPVEMSTENNRLAQGCALLMAANGSITHTPPASWECYSQEAADTAASSSVSSGPALESIDGYMIDPGNPTTIGHRRWILSSMLAGIGFGSAGRFSCQYQPAQRPPSGAPAWVAWPPPGQIPIDAFGTFFAKLDQTGWSVQSDSIDLASADVTVTSDGMPLEVTVTTLMRGYGSSYALRFNPSGWTAAAGKTYSVKITGTSAPIEYDVEVIDCP
jgi:hypothetical protein